MAQKRRPAHWLVAAVRRWGAILHALGWADVVHWHFGASALPGALDVRSAKLLGKPRLVEFWGSDIRIPEIASARNPYRARLGKAHEYADIESLARSRRTQRLFARTGFGCLVSSEELLQYVQPDLFPRVLFARQRVFVADYTPSYPDPRKRRPLVAHSPSAPLYKGTQSVLAAVDRLKERFDFDFVLNQGKPRHEALEAVSRADVFLDQFVGGTFGLAALEAMALGKPVLCYIDPALQAMHPEDLPIVNANPDNLPDVLENLLANGTLRRELGMRGRAYVEQHHDAHKIARELVAIYDGLRAEGRKV